MNWFPLVEAWGDGVILPPASDSGIEGRQRPR